MAKSYSKYKFMYKTCYMLTRYWHPKHIWQRHWELSESPGPGKVSSSNLFIDIHFQWIMIAAAKNTKYPHKHNIAIVSLDCGEGQDWESRHKKGCLAQVLFWYSTLCRIINHDTSKYYTSQCPCYTKVGMQQKKLFSFDTFFRCLLGLGKDKYLKYTYSRI